MKRLARFAPLMLLATLSAPVAANAQYGKWTSSRAAGTTYKQAHATSSFGSVQKHGSVLKAGIGKAHVGHASPSKAYSTKLYGSKTYGGKVHFGASTYGAYQGAGFQGYGHAPAPRRVWVAGHWSLRERKVWIAGRTESVWRPARFETRYDACGLAFTVQIQAGHYETIQHPGRWDWRTQRVWVPGGWSN